MDLHTNNNNVSLMLPETLGVRSIEPLIALLSQVLASSGNVELNCSEVKFVDPFGMTVLASVLETLAEGRCVAMPWLSREITSYLERMDFFNGIQVDGVDIPTNRIRHDQRSNLLEITRVNDSSKSEAVAEQLATAIVSKIIGRTAMPDDFHAPDTEYDQYYRPLRYALSELIENALTHARRGGRFKSSVWVSAQYYRQSGGSVQVAVVDNGCGFLATLKNHPELQEKTHAGAIRTALQPKVSCNRDAGPLGESVNEGVGLTTTVRISKATGGDVHIVSGNALLLDGGVASAKRRDQTLALQGSWEGVAISMTFVCRNLPSIRISDLLPPVEQKKGAKNLVVLRFDD